MEEMWNEWPRHAWRFFRKRIGLPASSDVGVLSDMIKSLLDMASPCHSHATSQSAVISYPSLVALCEEDVVDAAEYLGLAVLRGLSYNQPREIYVAYAGHGMGLCESYKDREKCNREGLQMPTRYVLLVEYTEQALLLDATHLCEARDSLYSYTDVTASFDLGSSNGREDGHTTSVKAFVFEYLSLRYPYQPQPKEIMVIMTGSPESVGDVAVQKAIEAAVEELGSTANMLTSMPEYVAARGAAELAWRALSFENAT